jgi:CBS domain-containing protein
MHSIHLNVLDFLKELGHKEDHLVVCSPKDTLRTIIKKFAQHGMHQIYIVDDKGHPISVVTLKDILSVVMSLK